MARKIDNNTPAKAAVVSRLCKTLGVESYGDLEKQVERLIGVVDMPVCAVTVAWKPMVAGGINFTSLGFDINDPIALQSAAQACSLIAQDLNTRAIAMAMSGNKVEQATVKEGKSDERAETRESTDVSGDET